MGATRTERCPREPPGAEARDPIAALLAPLGAPSIAGQSYLM
jgi:hypothetical protein